MGKLRKRRTINQKAGLREISTRQWQVPSPDAERSFAHVMPCLWAHVLCCQSVGTVGYPVDELFLHSDVVYVTAQMYVLIYTSFSVALFVSTTTTAKVHRASTHWIMDLVAYIWPERQGKGRIKKRWARGNTG